MFSENIDLDEAYRNIMELDFVMFTETFDRDLKKLATRLGRKLDVHREKSYRNKKQISPQQLERATELLAPEYELLNRVQQTHPSLVSQ